MMVFRRLLSTLLSESSFPLLPDEPTPNETVTRFLFQSNHFATRPPRVKGRALEPPEDRKTSVFRTHGLVGAEIWRISLTYIEPLRGKPTLARADFTIAAAERLGLNIEKDEPPPRHANMTNWSTEKEARISLAQQLRQVHLLSCANDTA